MHFKYLFFLLCFVGFLFSCKKAQPDDVIMTEEKQGGLLVLDEGLFQQNNAHLSYVDFVNSSVNNSFFEQKVGRPLGDTGNDIQEYQGRIYIVVNVSSTLEILDKASGTLIQQIPMQANGQAKQPRYIAFSGNQAFITCYDGFVDVLDLSSLTITQRIAAGANPEELVISNNKLYVANSGGLNAPNVDSTVSVIDLLSLAEIKRIVIGPNPGSLTVDDAGEVYAISRGDYAAVPSRLHRISSLTDEIVQTFTDRDVSLIEKMDGYLITVCKENGIQKIRLLDATSETFSNDEFLVFGQFETLYAIQYSPVTQKVYCFDAKSYVNSGSVFSFTKDGQLTAKYPVGLNPKRLIVYE